MENVITDSVAQDTATQDTAVLDVPAPSAPERTVGEVLTAAVETPATPVEQIVAQDEPLVFTHQELLNARELVLRAKMAGKFGGFGQKIGPMIRATIGYRFDSMGVHDVLKAMDTPDFLTKYQASTDTWFAGVKHDGSTGKSNTSRHTEASKLTSDALAFKALVKALRILCVRNQDWREKGANISLTMNGHRALLEFFGIQVTNQRRLKLAAN